MADQLTVAWHDGGGLFRPPLRQVWPTRVNDAIWYEMLEGSPLGPARERGARCHCVHCRIASWCRGNFPDEYVRGVIQAWRWFTHLSRVREAERRRLQRENAERADALLDEYLTPEQRSTRVRLGYFDVEFRSSSAVKTMVGGFIPYTGVQDRGRRFVFRIFTRSTVGNIRQIEPPSLEPTLCVYPSVSCPPADVFLAQMLWLQYNYRHLNQIAVRS